MTKFQVCRRKKKKTDFRNDRLHDKNVEGSFKKLKTEKWVKKQKKRYCLASDGNWDIKYMLVAESKKKNFTLAPVWYQYFNVRKEFTKQYSGFDIDNVSLKRMLRHLDLPFIGKKHCGLDDCLNVAAVCQKMVSDGHQFVDPEIIDKAYDPAKDTDIKDYSLSGPRPFEIPTEPTEVVRMRGLPWKATINHVKDFFLPVHVQGAGVNLFLDKLGRPSGEGCVVFSTVADAQRAISLKNRHAMMGRYVELFPCSLEQIKIISDVIANQS